MNLKQWLTISLIGILVLTLTLESADAGIGPKRDESPIVSIAKSTLLSAAAGSVIGLAIILVSDSSDNGEIMKWSFVGGTALGLGYGIYYVASAPETESAALHFEGRKLAKVQIPRLRARINASGDTNASATLVAMKF